eukprot:scpid75396/ scgid32382/ 
MFLSAFLICSVLTMFSAIIRRGGLACFLMVVSVCEFTVRAGRVTPWHGGRMEQVRASRYPVSPVVQRTTRVSSHITAVVQEICPKSNDPDNTAKLGVAPRNCTGAGSMAWFPCAFKHMGNRIFKRACSGPKRKRILNTCTIATFTLPLLESVVIDAFRKRKSPVKYACPDKFADSREFMIAGGRTYMQHCHLQSLLSPDQCQTPSGRCAILEDNECVLHWLAKTALHATSYLDDTSAESARAHRKVHCWEPEMQRAEQLFTARGRWDVSDRCFSTMESIAQGMITEVLRTLYTEIRRMYNKHKEPGTSHRPSSHHLQLMFERLPLFYEVGWASIQSLFIKPAFRRFRTTVNRRRQAGVNTTVFRCDVSTASSRDAIKMAALQFMRMLIINELRASVYRYRALVIASTLFMVLPCSLNAALSRNGLRH